MSDGMMGPGLTWLAAMAKHNSFSLNYISKLWRLAPFMDSELSAFLLKIEISRHAAGMQNLKELGLLQSGATVQNTDLTA